MHYKPLLIAVSLVIGVLAAEIVSANPISMIKSSSFPGSRNLTVGQVLDNYSYISNPEWKIIQSGQGQQIVQFKGKYSNYELAKLLCHMNFRGFENSERDIAILTRYFDNEGLNLYLLIEFEIAPSGNQWRINYTGYEHLGEPSSSDPALIPMFLQHISTNSPYLPVALLGTIPDLNKRMSFLFYKYILSNLPRDEYEWAKIIRLDNIPVGHMERTFQLYAILNIDNFSFDDSSNVIDLEYTLELTTAVTSQSEEFKASLLSASTLQNMKYKILQSKAIKSRIEQNTLEVRRMRLTNADLEINSIYPVNVTVDFQYRGGVDQNVISYLISPDDKLAKERTISKDNSNSIQIQPGYFKAATRDAEPVNIFLGEDGTGYAIGSGYDSLTWKQEGNAIILEGHEFMDHTAKIISPTSFELDGYAYSIDPKYKVTTYKYAEKGFSGQMVVVQDSSPNILHIEFDTAGNNSTHTCGAALVCVADKGEASCHPYGTDDPGEVTLKFSGDSVMVDTTYDRGEFCNDLGNFTGLYKK